LQLHLTPQQVPAMIQQAAHLGSILLMAVAAALNHPLEQLLAVAPTQHPPFRLPVTATQGLPLLLAVAATKHLPLQVLVATAT
jgi:hypothetical protein